MPVDQRKDYVVWGALDGSLIVRMAHDAVDRLSVDVMRGFGVTRKRGTEVGGILVGHIEPGKTKRLVIEDFEDVPCEYAFGPSYILSENDEPGFAQAAKRWKFEPGKKRHLLGFYRSHTRSGLGLADDDVRLFDRYLAPGAPSCVALLIKPFATRSCLASFFAPLQGRLAIGTPPDEFPFVGSAAVVSEEPERSHEHAAPRRRPDPPAEVAVPAPPVPAPVSPPPPLIEPAPVDPAPMIQAMDSVLPPVEPAPAVRSKEAERLLADVLGPRRLPGEPSSAESAEVPLFSNIKPVKSRDWKQLALWVSFTLAALGLGAVAGFHYAGGVVPPISVPPAQPAPPPPNPFSASLSVERQGNNLLLRWNRDSEVVKSALRGVLVIAEPRASKVVELPKTELESGMILYQRVASEVRFRLELVIAEDRTFVEAATWRVQPPVNPAPSPTKPAPNAAKPAKSRFRKR